MTRKRSIYTPIRRNVRARATKTIIPPSVAAEMAPEGPMGKPILLRLVRLRYNNNPHTPYARALAKMGKGEPLHRWRAIEITVPKEAIEITGWEAGMTICIEIYRDSLRMYTAGDVVSREEELI
jgi:hypothetical protein